MHYKITQQRNSLLEEIINDKDRQTSYKAKYTLLGKNKMNIHNKIVISWAGKQAQETDNHSTQRS